MYVDAAVVDSLSCIGNHPRLDIVVVRYTQAEEDAVPFDYFGVMWRFFAAEDHTVDCFVTRDLDDLLSCTGRNITLDWFDSPSLCHRQGSHDQFLCNGGWMGFKSGCFPDNFPVIHGAYVAARIDDMYAMDERWLSSVVWPAITTDTKVGLEHHRPYLSGAMNSSNWTQTLENKWQSLVQRSLEPVDPHINLTITHTHHDLIRMHCTRSGAA